MHLPVRPIPTIWPDASRHAATVAPENLARRSPTMSAGSCSVHCGRGVRSGYSAARPSIDVAAFVDRDGARSGGPDVDPDRDPHVEDANPLALALQVSLPAHALASQTRCE